jgi:cysteine synthase
VLIEKRRRLAELTIPPLTTDVASTLAALHHEYAEARALTHVHREGAKDGTSSMAEYKAAVEIARDLAARIVELTPRDPSDPSKDPANLEAAADVRARLTLLVEAQEKIFRCATCGGNPYRKE